MAVDPHLAGQTPRFRQCASRVEERPKQPPFGWGPTAATHPYSRRVTELHQLPTSRILTYSSIPVSQVLRDYHQRSAGHDRQAGPRMPQLMKRK